MYTFQHENADFAKLFTHQRPYAVAYIKGAANFSQAGGRILFFPAGDRGILAVATLRGLPVLPPGDTIFAGIAPENTKTPFAFPEFSLTPTPQGKIWCAILLGAFGIAEAVGRDLILTRQISGAKAEIVARGTIRKSFGQI